jgi:hypothetical protein
VESAGLRIPARYITMFNTCSGNNCPSARCASPDKLLLGTLIYSYL